MTTNHQPPATNGIYTPPRPGSKMPTAVQTVDRLSHMQMEDNSVSELQNNSKVRNRDPSLRRFLRHEPPTDHHHLKGLGLRALKMRPLCGIPLCALWCRRRKTCTFNCRGCFRDVQQRDGKSGPRPHLFGHLVRHKMLNCGSAVRSCVRA